ncbi:MAG: hypothetical protein ABID04_02690 [Patescibacteria group bacterium]
MLNLSEELSLARETGELYRREEEQRVARGELPWDNYGNYSHYVNKFSRVLSPDKWLGSGTPAAVLEVCGPLDFVRGLALDGLRLGVAVTLRDFRGPGQKAADTQQGLYLVEQNIWDDEAWVTEVSEKLKQSGHPGFDLIVLNPVGGLIIQTGVPGKQTISPSFRLQHRLLNQMWTLGNSRQSIVLAELYYRDPSEAWCDKLRKVGLTVTHEQTVYCVQGSRNLVAELPALD